jgi:hypothetical protein
LNGTLGLVCSGRVSRECRVQIPLIDLLCEYGAGPDSGMPPALPHGEFEAAHALIRNGAHMDLAGAAALGRVEEGRRLLPAASSEDRHRAFALAAQFGHQEIIRWLLDAGEDPTPVFRVAGLTFGIVICYDLTFREPAAAMAAQGARLLFVPTNNALLAARANLGFVQEARATDIARAWRIAFG